MTTERNNTVEASQPVAGAASQRPVPHVSVIAAPQAGSDSGCLHRRLGGRFARLTRFLSALPGAAAQSGAQGDPVTGWLVDVPILMYHSLRSFSGSGEMKTRRVAPAAIRL